MNALVEIKGVLFKAGDPGASPQQRQILTATCINLHFIVKTWKKNVWNDEGPTLETG